MIRIKQVLSWLVVSSCAAVLGSLIHGQDPGHLPGCLRGFPTSLLLKHQLSSPKWPEEGSLDFLAFYRHWKKPWPLPGMEWAGLSPKCKCHFSTSLVTTPFLAFIGNDIFLCSLSSTHASERCRRLLCFKRLEEKKKKNNEETCSPNTKEYREHKSGYGVTQAPCKVEERKDCLCVSLLLACSLLLFLFPRVGETVKPEQF